MNALEWQRMKGVLTGALAIPASERAAFLAGACEDEEMRRRAESLLVDADSAGAFLEAPALTPRPRSSRSREGGRRL